VPVIVSYAMLQIPFLLLVLYLMRELVTVAMAGSYLFG